MTANPKVFEFAGRKQAVATAKVQRKARQRTAQAAERLTRLGKARAAAELANEAVVNLIKLAYQIDPDTDKPANIDPVTGVLLIPAPWSSHNYRAWGLRATEADALRAYMLRLNETARQGKTPPPVFVYDEVTRRWGLNLWDYPRVGQALAWWARYELSAKGFEAYADHVRKKRGKGAKKARENA